MTIKFVSFVQDSCISGLKNAGHLAKEAGGALCDKYGTFCDNQGKKIGSFFGHVISPKLAEKLAIEALKVLPIALCLLAMNPTLSVSALVLGSAICLNAILSDPKIFSLRGKEIVLEGASLGFALQTALSVTSSLLSFSPINAVGAVLVGSIAASAALYQARNLG